MSKSDQKPIAVDDKSLQNRGKWIRVIHYSVWSVLFVCVSCMLIAIILPSFTRVRPRGRTPCATNLGKIGRACLTYAELNNGALPTSLEVLLEGGEQALLSPKDLICPKGKTAYIYIPGQHYMYDARNVIAYELISNHQGQGANVTYLDGHCAWSTPEMLQDELAQTKDRLAKAATQPTE